MTTKAAKGTIYPSLSSLQFNSSKILMVLLLLAAGAIRPLIYTLAATGEASAPITAHAPRVKTKLPMALTLSSLN